MGLDDALKYYLLREVIHGDKSIDDLTFGVLDSVADAEKVLLNRWFLAGAGLVALFGIGAGLMLFYGVLFVGFIVVQATIGMSALPFLLFGGLGTLFAGVASVVVLYMLYHASKVAKKRKRQRKIEARRDDDLEAVKQDYVNSNLDESELERELARELAGEDDERERARE